MPAIRPVLPAALVFGKPRWSRPLEGAQTSVAHVFRHILLDVVVAAALVACGNAAAPTSGGATGAIAATPTSAAPATSIPSAAPATVAVTPSGPHLTYVALGDSLLYALEEDCNSCTSAAVTYGTKASADLGIPVEVHNLTMHNGLASATLLAYLRQGTQIGRNPEEVRQAVASADIVSVTIGFNDSTMGAADNLAAFTEKYGANLDAILAQIGTLRAGKPTLVLVTDIYNNGIAAQPANDPDGPGTGVDIWKPIVDAQNKVICAVAKAHAALCVDIYHPFNGPKGLSSPDEAGYLGPDGVHPSQLGQDVIAEAMSKVGYGPLR